MQAAVVLLAERKEPIGCLFSITKGSNCWCSRSSCCPCRAVHLEFLCSCLSWRAITVPVQLLSDAQPCDWKTGLPWLVHALSMSCWPSQDWDCTLCSNQLQNHWSKYIYMYIWWGCGGRGVVTILKGWPRFVIVCKLFMYSWHKIVAHTFLFPRYKYNFYKDINIILVLWKCMRDTAISAQKPTGENRCKMWETSAAHKNCNVSYPSVLLWVTWSITFL